MKKTSFNADWKLGNETVTLPRDEMILSERTPDAPSSDAQAFFQGGSYIYEKTFKRPGKYAWLHFDGVYRNAKVYLNDTLIADVPYGYIPFFAQLNDLKEENILRVECDNQNQPDSRWYAGAGIYRDVTLFTSEGEYIIPGSLKISTLDYTKGLIHVSLRTSAQQNVSIQILDEDKCVAEAEGYEADLIVPDAKLWSAETPHLYRCVVKTDTDEESVFFGIRQVEKGSDGLYINGRKTLLKGGCIHHDNGLLGSAAYFKSEYRRIQTLKKAGFNAVRSAHNPASDALLRACDELGMYVMDETWDMWYNHKNRCDYASYWEDHHMEDIERMVERDFNHPSVILYSIGNEVSEPASDRGREDVREMTDLIHSLDQNRLVTGGFNLMIITNAAKGKGIYKEDGGMNANTNAMNGMNSTMFNLITSVIGSGMNKSANSRKSDAVCSPALDMLDITGYNYASGRYTIDLKLHPDRLIFGSETMPYDIGKNWKMVEEMPNLCGDFMWTAWDYIGENGIGAWAYTDDAKGFSKPYPWWLADTGAFDIIGDPNAEACWAMATWKTAKNPLITVQPLNHDQKIIKASWRGTNGIPSYGWKGCEGKKGTAEVFFNADTAELFLNGKKIGRKKIKENRAKFTFTYEPGTLEAVTYDAEGRENGRNAIVSADHYTRAVLHAEEECVKCNDIVYVAVQIEDTDGIRECAADREVTIEVENGELLAFGSADPRLNENHHDNTCRTYYGRAMAILKAGKAGILRVKNSDTVTEIKVEE